MNLKEAFRYQNKLQSFLDEAQSILDRDANITKVENTYLRRKVMAEAEDETVAAVPETEYYEQITDIARFLLHLLDEKETLSAAIRTAKDALDIDIDSEVSLNDHLRPDGHPCRPHESRPVRGLDIGPYVTVSGHVRRGLHAAL